MAALVVAAAVAVVFHRLVDVVHAAEEHRPCAVAEAQAKALQLVAPLSSFRRPGPCLHICRASDAVLPLQHHVHGVFLLALIVDAEELVLLRLLVIHLYVLHSEVGQVVEHHLVLALEEVGTVQRQVVNLLAVDEDFALVGQFHAWQLTYESVEHRPLGHVEGVGVIDQRVALPHHFYACGLHHHLAQRAALMVVGTGRFLQVDGRHVSRLQPSAHPLLRVVGEGRLVVGVFHLDDVVLRLTAYLEIVARRGIAAPHARYPCVAVVYTHGVHHGRIRLHQGDEGIGHGSLSKAVGHDAYDVERVLALLGMYGQ